MSTRLFAAAFALGLVTLAWVGWGLVGSSWLALTVTAAILAVYLVGAWELAQFRATTAGLRSALASTGVAPAALAEWLEHVPATLRQTVRLRIEGERVGLPGPALTPYLVGLLVMLGMLGTFLGMVVTFKGAVFALEGSTDLQAIRSALAEPIKGLGLSFGTSVAGVAASAMLGLMSALARRERQDAGRLLDQRIATVLLPFSREHLRQESFKALQAQAHALPAVVERLDAMMERIEQRSQVLDAQLLERHAQLQREVTQACTGLVSSVGSSLADSLAAGARAAGDTLRPVVESTMARVAEDAQRSQARLGEVAQAQVDTLSRQFEATAQRLGDGWAASLEQHRRSSEAAEHQRLQAWTEALHALAERTGAQAERAIEGVDRVLQDSHVLLRERTESEARWIEQHGARMEQLAGLWRTELAALRQEEAARGEAAVLRLGELQSAVTHHLATLGAALEAPMTRLLHTAAEVPQAAAGVMAQLREQMGGLAQRENAALQERTVLLEQLGTLLRNVNQAAVEQRAAIESLVGSASEVLAQGASRFGQVLELHTGQAADAAAQVTANAIELSSLAQAFSHGVELFQATNEKLVQSLQQIDTSLNRSITRSDEQLAYYVAQAREVIDLSIASQEGLVENLRELRIKPIAVTPAARS